MNTHATSEKIKIRGRKNSSFPVGKTVEEKEFYKLYGVWPTPNMLYQYRNYINNSAYHDPKNGL